MANDRVEFDADSLLSLLSGKYVPAPAAPAAPPTEPKPERLKSKRAGANFRTNSADPCLSRRQPGVVTHSSKLGLYQMRAYEPLWHSVRDRAIGDWQKCECRPISVRCQPELRKRIHKAVVKEKNMDTEFLAEWSGVVHYSETPTGIKLWVELVSKRVTPLSEM